MRAGVVAVMVLVLCSGCASSAAGLVMRPARRFLLVVQPVVGPELSRVESVDARGRVVRNLARTANDASVSPNGKLVALGERNGLYVERIGGSRPRRLIPGNVFNFAWSPDNKQLLVAVSDDSGMAVVTVATGAERLLPLPRKRSLSYAPIGWSGPAREILYEVYSGSWTHDLVVARPTGASPRTIYSDSSGGDDSAQASWSPDGKWVAYTFEITGEENWGFGVIDVASGKTTTLNNFNQFLQAPVWAPDSSRFVVGGYRRPVAEFSNRGVPLGAVSHSESPFAWTHAGIYLGADTRAGSEVPVKLVLLPTGQTVAQPLLSFPRREWVLAVQPLG